MNNKKVHKILKGLVDFEIPDKYRETVRYWLHSDFDKLDKEYVMNQLWDETPLESNQSIDKSLKETWQKIRLAERKINRHKFIRNIARVAAVILLPVITGLSVWYFSSKELPAPEMIECYVDNGQIKTVILPDKSQVCLNAGSLLIYPSRFTADKRQVYLSGEANFIVEGNPDSPFIVSTGILNTEVLGTKFNVESYAGSGIITTTLENGSLKVYSKDNPHQSILMYPNEQVSYLSHENRFTIRKVEPSDYSAWMNGELRFINKSLDEILFTLERKYDVRFLIDSSVKFKDLYTMKFKAHETIEDALYVMGEIIGTIDFHREGQTIHINIKKRR